MKINVKITANIMAGSLCGYITYRNYLSTKTYSKGNFLLLNPLEEAIIWEILFYIFKLIERKSGKRSLFKKMNYVNMVQNTNLIFFWLGNKSFLAFPQDCTLLRNRKWYCSYFSILLTHPILTSNIITTAFQASNTKIFWFWIGFPP